MNRGEEIGVFIICFGIATIIVDSLDIFSVDYMILLGVIAIALGILVTSVSKKLGKALARI